MSRRRTRDEDDVTDDEPSPSSSQGSKRRRLDTPNGAPIDDLLPDSFRRSPRGRRFSRHAEEKHQPGSLIRISVKNFVTYTKATFKCGPSLNMIIGPNGTGKSTLVCAICLGLGSKPAVLGRSKEMGEYVKNGTKEAEIEVELAGREGQTNPIIQHTIKRDGNKSSWRINGRQRTHKEVVTLVRSFNIQIDNLCQFLPQDRVVEFAQMTPVGLLESTQKAAAREEMSVWHTTLKQLGVERLSMQSKNLDDVNALSNLEKRHAQQQGEVERIIERKALLIRQRGLEMVKPVVQYSEEKDKFKVMKDTKKELEQDLRALTEQVAPSLHIVTDTEERVRQLKESVNEAEGIFKRWDTETIPGKSRAIETKRLEIETCDTEHQVEVSQYKKRATELQQIDQTIKKLKHLLEQEPSQFDAAAFNVRIREQDTAVRELKQKAEDLRAQEAELKVQTVAKNNQWESARAELADLQSSSGQQLAKLRALSSDTAKAYLWLQKNAHEFKDKIYGPPLIECNVKDPRYAAALESIMGKSDILSFTATNRDDWKKFLDVCQNRLRIKDVTTKVAAQPLSFWQAPLPKDQLQSYGLEEFAIDVIEGPEPVLSMLCDAVRMHRTGVSLNDISDAQFEELQNSPVNTWVAGRNSYKVNRRREYGPSAVSTMVSQLKPAKIWVGGSSTDTDAHRQLHQRIKDIERDLADLEEAYQPIKDQLEDFKEQTEHLESEKKRIAQEKADAQRAHNEWVAIPRKLETIQEKRDSKQQLQDETRDKLEEIRARKQTFFLQRAQLAIDLTMALDREMQMQEEIAEIEIQLIEAESELGLALAESQRVRDMLDQRKREIREYETKIARQKEYCLTLAAQFKRNQAELETIENGEEIQAVIDRWSNNLDLDTGEALGEDEARRTIEDLDAEIVATRSRIELLHEGNPRALEHFEARAAQIEQLKEKIARFQADFAALTQAIDETRAKWEPELDSLVEQISSAFAHNFERIGCAGQVSVRKDDNDFREWAIQIEVKFRENEELAILDSHRQSGGERAVSTIFYLMALQSMARSPFRVVDEINQGMDPRNERMVHERMVDIACSENTSQYFLVTPKLLNGLKYDPRMVVHIIYSGSEMPANEDAETEGILDLNKLAERAMEMGEVH